MMTHKETRHRPNAKKVPKNTLAVFHEEIGYFGGSDTCYTYYITNGNEWRKISNCFGRLLSLFYAMTFQWNKRFVY